MIKFYIMAENALKIQATAVLQCTSCRLKACPVFTSLREKELQEIDKIKKNLVLKKGSVIVSEGDSNFGTYIIRSGLMKVYKSCQGRGQDLIFAFAKPGDIVDMASYQSDENNVSVESLSESQLCFFELKLFRSALSRFPAMVRELLTRACRELSRTRNKTLDVIYHPVESRLAHFLLYLKDAGLNVYLSREEMARAVGCSLETLIRLVSQFRKKGIIRIRNKELSIIDLNALINLTNGRPNHGWQ